MSEAQGSLEHSLTVVRQSLVYRGNKHIMLSRFYTPYPGYKVRAMGSILQRREREPHAHTGPVVRLEILADDDSR